MLLFFSMGSFVNTSLPILMSEPLKIPREYQIRVQEIMLDELKQTAAKQAIYEKLGGNIFVRIPREVAISNCEKKLNSLRKETAHGKAELT
ncbi:unnamed protein product [Calicophoron daubneyi]|uniref:Uncharacterized protein n=1 Tax=Calicophoron daubneyi TaxID=300641 RepID=A0AAV2T1A8_CALDB